MRDHYELFRHKLTSSIFLLSQKGNKSCQPFPILFALFSTSGSHACPVWNVTEFLVSPSETANLPHRCSLSGTLELPKPLGNACMCKLNKTYSATLYTLGTLLSIDATAFAHCVTALPSTMHALWISILLLTIPEISGALLWQQPARAG
jgi:hypothetical protein